MTAAVASFTDPTADAQLAAAPLPRRALFLDRDGVVNVDHGYVHAAARTDWIPGIFELVRDAHELGYLPVIVTNQAGIARGLYSEAQFLAFTRWVHLRFAEAGAPLLATYYCPHHPTAGIGPWRQECGCRKPGPGMLLAAASDHGIDLRASRLVGDKDKDLQAAKAAGVGGALLFDPLGTDSATIHRLADATHWLHQGLP